MPPKKKTKATANSAVRSKDKPDDDEPASQAGTTGKRKRGTANNSRPNAAPATTRTTRSSQKSTASQASQSETTATNASPRQTPKKATPKKKAAPAKPKVHPVEAWFQEYANPDSGLIDPITFGRWMDDLGVSSEGIFMYFILYECNAKTQMSISKDEFMDCFTSEAFGVHTNEDLRNISPGLLADLKPKPRPEPNPAFKDFYLWCFTHFKPEGQKNLPLDVAQILFQTLLDPDKYSLDWKPLENGSSENGVSNTSNPFPHVKSFLDFLNSDPRPVGVITKDQYEQFYEFNLSVSRDLGEHTDDSAWPALLDSYVEWRKANDPEKSKSAEGTG